MYDYILWIIFKIFIQKKGRYILTKTTVLKIILHGLGNLHLKARFFYNFKTYAHIPAEQISYKPQSVSYVQELPAKV